MSNVRKDSCHSNDLPDYTVKISKQKGIRMRVTPRGDLVVHANPFCSQESIQRFVSLHAQKLKLEKIAPSILLFGKSFKVKEVKGKTNHVSTNEDELIIQHREISNAKDVYDNFLKQYAKEVFDDIAQMIMIRFKAYALEMPELKIKTLKKSWGICHPGQNYITLNLELVHYPVEFVEYVICHEFVHLLVANHSDEFYKILEKVMPDYKRRFDLIETGEEKQYLM